MLFRSVAQGNAHVGLFRPILAGGHARGESDFFEMSAAVVLVEIIPARIVGQKKIEMAVAIEVGPDGGESKELEESAIRLLYPSPADTDYLLGSVSSLSFRAGSIRMSW